jgi:hypothetical protein
MREREVRASSDARSAVVRGRRRHCPPTAADHGCTPSREKTAKYRALLSVVCSTFLVTALGTPLARAGDKVTLCHFPPGNPGNFHTISVSPSAAEAHIANHGDVPGECCAIDDVCDDGDACTANFCSDNVCTSEPVDCDDGNPCTNEVGCDPQTGCIHGPVVCDPGQTCHPGTGACLPVGQCPCWLGSNPIDEVTEAASGGFACVERGRPTCDGNDIRVSGEGSGPNGAFASQTTSLHKPSADSCFGPSSSGGGNCSCPPPPEPCPLGRFAGFSFPRPLDEPNTCVAEFEAACAALQ